MTLVSKTAPTGSISLSDLRRQIRQLPSGSRQRTLGAFWLAWLEHIRKCQNEGMGRPSQACLDHRSMILVQEAAYPHGWHCCDTHKRLREEREMLKAYAESLDLGYAPHHDRTVLTPAWWLLHGGGRKYDIRREVTT